MSQRAWSGAPPASIRSSTYRTVSLTAPFSIEFAIRPGESAAFAQLSGDYNPLHINALFSRRTQFGGTVAHGIHVLLKALDGLGGTELVDGFEPLAISCTFNNPLSTDSIVRVDARLELLPRRLRLVGHSEGRLVFSATVGMQRSAQTAKRCVAPDSNLEPASPRVHSLPPVGHEGAVRLQLGRVTLAELFPRLAEAHDVTWIANLIATTRIVGMECPGMHSIYSSLRLRRSEESAERTTEWMRYTVQKSDQRFRMMHLRVEGAGFEGIIEAFLRAAPVSQMLLSDVASKVSDGAFKDQRALVIGGSRGLGELTAKILIAGGADVTVTYATGREDAERIVEESVQLGRKCTTVQLNAAAPIDKDLAESLATTAFSHVYYFASPHISKNVAGHWNQELYNRFCGVYVEAFAAVAEAILSGAKGEHRLVRFFFPSTVFLDSPETGFAEYCAAKAAGESLCAYLSHKYRALFARPRLPRMRTDQTSGLPDVDAQEPFAVMHPILIRFNAADAETGPRSVDEP